MDVNVHVVLFTIVKSGRKITQISINGQIDEPVVINTYNGISFSRKKQ